MLNIAKLEFDILQKYRIVVCPNLGDVQGKHSATHSKDELLDILKEWGVDKLHLCKIGGTDTCQETLCKEQFAMGVKEKHNPVPS